MTQDRDKRRIEMSFLATTERPVRRVGRIEMRGRLQAACETAAAGEAIDFVPSGKGVSKSLRVLVVDDYRATADTLSSLVTIWGHEVRRAYDGTKALRLAAAFQPDVLLLDILMPNMSGFEVAMQVRRLESLDHCFIVAVTGRADAAHRSRCYEMGVDLVLTKPVVPSHMQTLLLLELERVRQLQRSAMDRTSRREPAGANPGRGTRTVGVPR
jgi:CheY-like chemotaxis protein